MKNFKLIPLLLAAFLVWGGAAQALTLRIGAGDPENSEMGVVGNTFKKFIEEKTNGKVKVECFYSASLGDETECLRNVQKGSLPIAIAGIANLVPFESRLGILTLPYLFDNLDEEVKGTNGAPAELLNSYAQEAGLRILAWTFSGFRYITNSKHPITKLEDIRGLRFRVPQSVAMIETYRAFGAIPSTLAWNMTYKALEHDLVDGQCCDYASFKGMKFFEAGQKYLTEIHYTFQLQPLVLSERIYAKMPPELQKIVVDAGNGAGGFYASQVLAPLGADVSGSQFLEPDGMFPNHIPNPEDKTAMASITAAVKGANADLGIIFDTDVDRAGAVLSDCSELNRNRIIAMLAAILLREHPGTTIVTDSITSTGLAEFIAEKGGVHHRFKRGYRNVINESIRLNDEGKDSQLAIETSGHGALKENYFLDDGAYLVTKLLIELARGKKEGYTLESLIATLKEPAESVEFRMNILLDDFKTYGQQVIDELTAYAKQKDGWDLVPNNYEGVRVNIADGWFLLRLSLHDPLLPLNIESNSVGGAKIIAAELAQFIKNYDKLAADALLNYAE